MESHEWKFARHLIVVAGCASLALAQTTPDGAERNGLHLYNVMTSVGYSAGTNDFLPVQPGATEAGVMGIISATVGYTQTGARSRLALIYTPSYVRTYNSSVRAYSHNLSLSASTPLSQKWSMFFAGAAVEMSLDQLLFEPTSLSQLATAPGTFQDLSGAVVGQGSSSAQVASLVTGLSLTDSLSRGLVYGDRLFGASAQAGLTYAYSTRLKVTFSGGVTFAQSRPDSTSTAEQRAALIPRSTSGDGGVSVSYAVTPRTEIGADASTVRVYAGPTNYLVTRSTGSIGRQLTRRWFATVHAGAGALTPLHQANAGPVKPALTWSTSTGYTYGTHTLLGTFSHMVGDLYGFGATSTDGYSGTWDWHQPQRRWGLSVSAGRELIRRDVDIVSWQVSSAVSLRLSRETGITFVGAYLNSTGALIGTRTDLSGWSGRMTFVWTPSGRWATVAR
jgi:hypothetical protein